MSSDDELPDIPYCLIRAKKKHTNREEAFLTLQRRCKELLVIPTRDHSDSERKEYNRLWNKYIKDKKHILIWLKTILQLLVPRDRQHLEHK